MYQTNQHHDKGPAKQHICKLYQLQLPHIRSHHFYSFCLFLLRRAVPHQTRSLRHSLSGQVELKMSDQLGNLRHRNEDLQNSLAQDSANSDVHGIRMHKNYCATSRNKHGMTTSKYLVYLHHNKAGTWSSTSLLNVCDWPHVFQRLQQMKSQQLKLGPNQFAPVDHCLR